MNSLRQYNDLSLKERAAIIHAAVKNGYRSLPDIVDAYNRFADGGHLYEDGDYLQYSDTSTYSGMTTDQIRDLQKQQIQTYQQAAQEGIDYTDKYYQSEGFKRRAAAQNFTGEPRLANPKLDPKKNIANSTATSIGLVSSTLANAKAKSIGLDAPYQQVPRYTDNPLTTAAHEAGHIKSPYERTFRNEDGSLSQTVMPQYFQDILKTGKVIKGQNIEHDSQIRERYSDLIGTRANLYKLGIFDSTDPNAVFTPQMYWEYKNKVGKMGDRFLEMFDQDNFIKAINDIAMNDVQNTESQYAANGGYLFKDGGNIDWDKTFTGKLINYAENPDSVGYQNGLWYAPINPIDPKTKKEIKKYDTNQFGMGVDRNQTEGFSDKVKKDKKGRQYLTEKDERLLRFNAITKANNSANARYKYAQKVMKQPDGKVSKKKDAATVSAIYNLGPGFVANTIFEDKNVMNLLFNGTDEEYINEIHKYYKQKGRNERIKRERKILGFK